MCISNLQTITNYAHQNASVPFYDKRTNQAYAQYDNWPREAFGAFEAIWQYNKTIHSITKEKPEVKFFNKRGYPDIQERLQQNQERILRYYKLYRKQLNYKQGDVRYSKMHRRNKSVKKCSKYIGKKTTKEQ